ncbi:hypothetical protein LAZ67_16001030 [Cordylochernes scorpioides]|uniref:Carboxylesterase type B domain-containing protein n=1 Tax=Cordylochernes scorpioides TaxID=51811 RepID=A0ABY6LDQ2_9ARAC|nr:hypothetical protein LAZ67_16001030 [Cordylochernes scorpioides]
MRLLSLWEATPSVFEVDYQPPTGERRFKDPEPFINLPRYIKATKFPPSCWQKNFRLEEHANNTMNEDCLYLNIWAPSQNAQMAVLVFIHGGAFEYGSSDELFNNPQYLSARTDMVIVTVNYRVGSLGFLDLNMEGSNGNFGLKDQILALKWIQKNIKVFGGDPDMVTLYGGEGFDDFGEHDIEELLVDEALNDDDILESMVDTTKDFETVDSELEDVTPLDEKLLREGLQLSGKLEIFFIQNDNDVERALKFQRDLKFCMSGYRELYKELVKPSQRLITDYLENEIDIYFLLETNVISLDNERAFFYSYSAVVVPAATTVRSGLACIFTAVAIVHPKQILWLCEPAIIGLFILENSMIYVNNHISYTPDERCRQLLKTLVDVDILLDAALENTKDITIGSVVNVRHLEIILVPSGFYERVTQCYIIYYAYSDHMPS